MTTTTLKELDDDHPLWLANAQIDGLLEGLGASEDHDGVKRFLAGAGLVPSLVDRVHLAIVNAERPIDMVLHCPSCHTQHIDAPEAVRVDECPASGQGCSIGPYGRRGELQCKHCGSPSHWTNPPHRSHLCRHCGTIWRPADVPTNGVAAIKTKGKADKLMPAPAAQQAPAGDGHE